jgi:hypothetical protein
MIHDTDDSQAIEVGLKPKIGKVLEARCRAPSTPQRKVKRARIVLLAAEGRSTRSIAEEVGVQPRIVSNWRRRFADHGLGGLKDRPPGVFALSPLFWPPSALIPLCVRKDYSDSFFQTRL